MRTENSSAVSFSKIQRIQCLQVSQMFQALGNINPDVFFLFVVYEKYIQCVCIIQFRVFYVFRSFTLCWTA